MNQKSYQSLLAFNEAMKLVDDVYRKAVKQCGLSECAFWILYTLRMEKLPYTQSTICEFLHEPKQTVNSALKKLEAEGYLLLSAGEDQRSKLVRLTEKGNALVRAQIDPVAEAEARALAAMTPMEREALICMTRRYGELLESCLKSDEKGENAAARRMESNEKPNSAI